MNFITLTNLTLNLDHVITFYVRDNEIRFFLHTNEERLATEVFENEEQAIKFYDRLCSTVSLRKSFLEC